MGMKFFLQFFLFGVWSTLVFTLWHGSNSALFAQLQQTDFYPADFRPANFRPGQRPAIKLVGYLNPNPPKTNVRPVLTLAFPGHDKHYTFVMVDMQILAGPILTPGTILSEVMPFTPSFYVRLSPADVKRMTSATPAQRLTIMAEYGQRDRSLLVTGFEKSEQPRMH